MVSWISFLRCLIFLDMLVINQEVLPNDNLNMHVLSLVDIDDWSDKCRACGRLSLLHEGEPCMRTEKESPDVILNIWNNFFARPMLSSKF